MNGSASAESSRSWRNGSASPKSEPPTNAQDHSQFIRYRSPSPATSGRPSTHLASRGAESRSRSRSRTISPPPRSRSRSRSRSLSAASMSRSSDSHTVRSNSTPNSANKTALHIEYLTHNVRESHLRRIFGWYGQVERVYLVPAQGGGRDTAASAYVMMRSVEQAAKAALYMTKGQIDGSTITIKTCEPPQHLPREGQRNLEERQQQSTAPRRDQRRDDYRYRSDHFRHTSNSTEDRGKRHESNPTWSRRERASHPDRFDYDRDRQDESPKRMRRWGRSDHLPSSSRGRERSRSRSWSPPSPHRLRRASATMRASPSY